MDSSIASRTAVGFLPNHGAVQPGATRSPGCPGSQGTPPRAYHGNGHLCLASPATWRVTRSTCGPRWARWRKGPDAREPGALRGRRDQRSYSGRLRRGMPVSIVDPQQSLAAQRTHDVVREAHHPPLVDRGVVWECRHSVAWLSCSLEMVGALCYSSRQRKCATGHGTNPGRGGRMGFTAPRSTTNAFSEHDQRRRWCSWIMPTLLAGSRGRLNARSTGRVDACRGRGVGSVSEWAPVLSPLEQPNSRTHLLWGSSPGYISRRGWQ